MFEATLEIDDLWRLCLARLESRLSDEAMTMWVQPVQGFRRNGALVLLAPNTFVRDTLARDYGSMIVDLARELGGSSLEVTFEVGGYDVPAAESARESAASGTEEFKSNLDPAYTFDSFVEGRSNQLAKAAAMQVSDRPGRNDYNPLLFYGGTGLGKTHLMHAVGNELKAAGRSVVYMHSEQFVSQMIHGIRHRTIDDFKARYRSVNALLIDDIQFFARKERSQEEFFHTFNSLLEGKHQVILTCDRYPKEVDGIEARLKSRFGWGLSVAIEPPDFETRVAILMTKSQAMGMELGEPVAYFIAKRIRSNVRDLEGALNTLNAAARFRQASVTLDFAQEVLRDLLTVHQRQITIASIQKIVAEFAELGQRFVVQKAHSGHCSTAADGDGPGQGVD